jgi:hypothetical protein
MILFVVVWHSRREESVFERGFKFRVKISVPERYTTFCHKFKRCLSHVTNGSFLWHQLFSTVWHLWHTILVHNCLSLRGSRFWFIQAFCTLRNNNWIQLLTCESAVLNHFAV